MRGDSYILGGLFLAAASAASLVPVVAYLEKTPENRVPTPDWATELTVNPGKYQCHIKSKDQDGKWYSVNEKVSPELKRVGSELARCAISDEKTTCTWKRSINRGPMFCTPA